MALLKKTIYELSEPKEYDYQIISYGRTKEHIVLEDAEVGKSFMLHRRALLDFAKVFMSIDDEFKSEMQLAVNSALGITPMQATKLLESSEPKVKRSYTPRALKETLDLKRPKEILKIYDSLEDNQSRDCILLNGSYGYTIRQGSTWAFSCGVHPIGVQPIVEQKIPEELSSVVKGLGNTNSYLGRPVAWIKLPLQVQQYIIKRLTQDTKGEDHEWI